MKILINCSVCKIGGGVQVAHSFLNEISNREDHDFIVVMSSIINEQIDRDKFKSNFTFYVYDMHAGPYNTLFSSNKFLDSLVEKHRIDRVFTVFGPSYWKPKVKHICGYAKPHYVYKDSPFYDVISIKEKAKLKVKEFFHLLDFKKNTDILITENPDVTRKIKSILINKEVYTVTNTYNQIFDNPQTWEEVKLPEFEGNYLLTISANYIHKNLQIIPAVISELLSRGIRNFKFALSLNKGDLSCTSEIDQYIVYLGYVSINQCPSLYQKSKYLFLPTLLECFSASYVEAMKMEKIILTSDLDFARGICKDAAVYFNPLDPKDIVDKLIAIDNDINRQNTLIQNGKNQLAQFDNYTTRAVKYLEIIQT